MANSRIFDISLSHLWVMGAIVAGFGCGQVTSPDSSESVGSHSEALVCHQHLSNPFTTEPQQPSSEDALQFHLAHGDKVGSCQDLCAEMVLEAMKNAQGQTPPGKAKGKGKVAICHIPPGNPGNAHTIVVGAAATNAHLAHGDLLGPCPPPCNTPDEKPVPTSDAGVPDETPDAGPAPSDDAGTPTTDTGTVTPDAGTPPLPLPGCLLNRESCSLESPCSTGYECYEGCCYVIVG
jgi:hypothetical protein